MASWMVHLRIADALLGKWEHISPMEFVVGNIAPDSGIPNEDWTRFSPDTRETHFKVPGEDGKGLVVSMESVRIFTDRFFCGRLREGYTREEYSFFLGYWTHLVTDVQWAERVYRPSADKFGVECAKDKHKLVWEMKRDWYDLDALYLKRHPDFKAFAVYEGAAGFVNRYMNIFSQDAFDLKRGQIVDFYRREAEKENLEREYVYLTEAEADAFVEETAKTVMELSARL